MTRPLNNSNAWDEIYTHLKVQNPMLESLPADTLRPYKLVANASGKNTTLFLVAKQSAGISGTMSVSYDRIDPATFFTKFGAVNKIPNIYHFEAQGTAVAHSALLPKINNVLGVNLTMSGDYQDLVDGTVTMPAKDASTLVSVGTNNTTAANFPLRLIGGKSVQFNLVNRGKKVSDRMTIRTANPYVKADRDTLQWDIYPKKLSAVQVSQDLLLRNLDFTDLFGTERMLADSLEYHSTAGEANVVFYAFKPAVLAEINARLTSVGIAPIVAGKNVMFPWSGMSSYPMPNQWLNYASPSESCRTIAAIKAPFLTMIPGYYSSINIIPPQCNPAFGFVLKVYPSGWLYGTLSENVTMYTDGPPSQRFMLLHFNRLT